MPELDKKVTEVFAGKVVRKDLVRQVKVGANVPTYVLEYLLGKYCATNDPIAVEAGLRLVHNTLADHIIRPDEAMKAQSRVKELRRPEFACLGWDLGRAHQNLGQKDLCPGHDPLVCICLSRPRLESGQITKPVHTHDQVVLTRHQPRRKRHGQIDGVPGSRRPSGSALERFIDEGTIALPPLVAAIIDEMRKDVKILRHGLERLETKRDTDPLAVLDLVPRDPIPPEQESVPIQDLKPF